jgi:hypothetical protein
VFEGLIPSIDLSAFVGPAIVVAVVAIFGWVFVVGGIRSYMSGDGHFGIIEAYVGFVRHGKTMLCAQDCLALARVRNAILVANIGISCSPACRIEMDRQAADAKAAGDDRWSLVKADMTTMRHFPEHLLLPITDDGLDLEMLEDLAFRLREEGRGLVLMIDEAGIVMPARQWTTFPVRLMWLLQQSGKMMVEIRYTTQHPSFVDSQLRALTAVVHDVRCTPPPTIQRRIKGRRPWFMVVTTRMVKDFDKVNEDVVMWKRRVRYRRAWEGSYDTDAAVMPPRRVQGGEGIGSDDGRLDPRLAAQIEFLPQRERQKVRAGLAASVGGRRPTREGFTVPERAPP